MKSTKPAYQPIAPHPTSVNGQRSINPGDFDALPECAWVRQAQLVRHSNSRESAIAPLPFSPATLWRMVKGGKFPKPTKLSAGVTAWQVSQVRAWMAAQAMV